ncbi:MAG: hypothetical protein AB7T27_09535 [Kiritimatiellia bacterium]
MKTKGFEPADVVLIIILISMITVIGVPMYLRIRQTGQTDACMNNLSQLDKAKDKWAVKEGKTKADTPTQTDLLPYLQAWPVCPANGAYTLNRVGTKPECSVEGHVCP